MTLLGIREGDSLIIPWSTFTIAIAEHGHILITITTLLLLSVIMIYVARIVSTKKFKL